MHLHIHAHTPTHTRIHSLIQLILLFFLIQLSKKKQQIAYLALCLHPSREIHLLEEAKKEAVVKMKMRSQRDTWQWVWSLVGYQWLFSRAVCFGTHTFQNGTTKEIWQVGETLNKPFSRYEAVFLLLFGHNQADVTLKVF